MKHIFLVALIIGVGILTRAQTEYEVSGAGANKILKGLISRDMLETDTAFKWFHDNQAGYTPAAEEVALLKTKRAHLQFLVFGATWNNDSQQILPRFFSLIDAASLGEDQVTLIGVDRDKKTVNHLSEIMHISQVPTFIIMNNGQEVGRVMATGNDGEWGKEIAAILNTKF